MAFASHAIRSIDPPEAGDNDAMHPYGVREVEKLLQLPRHTIRALVNAGFVKPKRGPRNALLFSFQDLIVLRTARALVQANVPHRRIAKSVKALRERLPESMPLSGLSICAVAEQVVVREGAAQWRAESGQYLLAFEGDPEKGSLAVIEHAAPDSIDAEAAYERGESLERTDAAAALRAYESALDADPGHLDARINYGRLLHEAGRLAEAERAYREALKLGGDDPLLQFNLGVVLGDLGRADDAIAAYEASIRGDASFADAHYNLALLCEKLARPKDAIRHMAQYRRLVR